ncbi:MAG: PKD domain-containing protein, partial [Candidatus Hydrogenedentes bacterium]|nr:PKD domain-containing protein [Candidatus Hydrogenedentota bacterium]
TDVVAVSQVIEVDEPPVPDCGAWPQEAPTNASIQFFDQSDATNSEPILGWFWTFGDGEISVEQDPAHVYTVVGDHTVTLTLTFEHAATGVSMSVTETKAGFIRINP